MGEQEQDSHPICKYVHPALHREELMGKPEQRLHPMHKYVHPAQTEAGF
jgi:hypothetical protein